MKKILSICMSLVFLTEGLAINYSGGSSIPDDVAAWLEQNHINTV